MSSVDVNVKAALDEGVARAASRRDDERDGIRLRFSDPSIPLPEDLHILYTRMLSCVVLPVSSSLLDGGWAVDDFRLLKEACNRCGGPERVNEAHHLGPCSIFSPSGHAKGLPFLEGRCPPHPYAEFLTGAWRAIMVCLDGCTTGQISATHSLVYFPPPVPKDQVLKHVRAAAPRRPTWEETAPPNLRISWTCSCGPPSWGVALGVRQEPYDDMGGVVRGRPGRARGGAIEACPNLYEGGRPRTRPFDQRGCTEAGRGAHGPRTNQTETRAPPRVRGREKILRSSLGFIERAGGS